MANQQNQNTHVSHLKISTFFPNELEGNWFQTNERRYLSQKKNILNFIKSQ